jgi:histidine phosphotransfer protein HptB
MIQPHTPSPYLDASVLADIRAISSPAENILAEVVGSFVAEVPGQILDLLAAIDACDAEKASRIAHSLKGTALGLGAFRMAQICGAVEQAARAGGLDRAATSAHTLPAEYESTRIALAREVAR